MQKLKPDRLKKGDTVAIVSPSLGLPSIFPSIYESGLKALENLGLKIKEYPSARKEMDFLYRNPEFRAKDINDAFADPEVKAIIASIGGDDSVRILPFLDLELIKKNPKIIMGYSDATAFNSYLNHATGLVTLNGPCVMAGFSQWNSLPIEFQKHIQEMLFEAPKSYEYKPYDAYSNGYPDWTKSENLGKVNEPIKNSGWTWLQGEGKVHGELFGGCIEVFEMLKSASSWPAKNFWQGKILFLETSEDKPTPDMVKCMLRNYGMQGIFDKIAGLIVGRPREYSEEERVELNKKILNVIRIEFKNEKLPIVTNMDFGHTDPQWIMPLGIEAEIDCEKKSFKLLEAPFL